MLKSDVINVLGKKYEYSSFLGISVTTTGKQHALVSEQIFSRKYLLIYDAEAKNIGIEESPTFRTAMKNSSEIISTIQSISGHESYDLVFIDPYHSYENSYEDIVGAFSLVKDGGALVIHDCNPPTEISAGPTFTGGEWCGLTYWAFIDFVIGRSGIRYTTLDADYGCGIIFKDTSARPDTNVVFEHKWVTACNLGEKARFRFFDMHRRELLHLTTISEFVRNESVEWPPGFVFATKENFDEHSYLNANPDVQSAVELGHFTSGREHFDFTGNGEGRLMQAPNVS